jgi:hypothetical protein
MTRADKDVSFSISSVCFLIYFLLKPFYLFDSGTLQPGDFFLLISFAFLVYERKKGLRNDDYIFGAFLLCVIIINGIYFLIFQSSFFVKSCLYYIFNYIVILCFRHFMYNKPWLKALAIVCKMNLLVQLAIFLLHKGSYWEGTYRYMGTYTDPNQLGFAVISTLAILFLLKDKFKYLYVLVAALLILQTSSSGMLFALLILVSLDCMIMLKRYMEKGGMPYSVLFLVIIGIGALITLIMLDVIRIDWDHFRVSDKLNNNNSVLQNFINDRALNVAQEHPEYFLFGYGEGFQFPRYGHQEEMHSTWISLCYYYGVLPFCILIAWIYSNVRHIKLEVVPIYCAIFLEAFTLVNHRQASFWMIILLANVCCLDDSINEYNDELEIEENKSA